MVPKMMTLNTTMYLWILAHCFSYFFTVNHKNIIILSYAILESWSNLFQWFQHCYNLQYIQDLNYILITKQMYSKLRNHRVDCQHKLCQADLSIYWGVSEQQHIVGSLDGCWKSDWAWNSCTKHLGIPKMMQVLIMRVVLERISNSTLIIGNMIILLSDVLAPAWTGFGLAWGSSGLTKLKARPKAKCRTWPGLSPGFWVVTFCIYGLSQ